MKKERMNNKGFSLVELIIVIAIMAVLVVVLAPQFLKYVEKARISTDKDNAAAIVTALQVWAAAEGNPDTSDNATVIVGTAGINLTSGSWAEAACNDAGIVNGNAAIQSKSASWNAGYGIKMGTDGQISYLNAAGTGAMSDKDADGSPDIADSDYEP